MDRIQYALPKNFTPMLNIEIHNRLGIKRVRLRQPTRYDAARRGACDNMKNVLCFQFTEQGLKDHRRNDPPIPPPSMERILIMSGI